MKKLSTRQLGKILYYITVDLEEKKIPQAIDEFLILLQKQQMIKKIKLVIDSFTAYFAEQQGAVPISVESVRQVSPSVLKKIAQALGSTAIPTVTKKTDLIGGIIVRKGNTVFDASIRGQLIQLKQTLIS